MLSTSFGIRCLWRALVVTAVFALVGCANFNSIHRALDTSSGQGVLIDVKQRAIIVGQGPGQAGRSRNVICAEPSPDALSAYAAQLSGELGLSPVNGAGTSRNLGIRSAMQEAAAFVGMRTPSVQLLRDAMYRVCEAYANGAIADEEYELLMRRYQRHIVAMMAIEQLTQASQVPPITLVTSGNVTDARSLAEWNNEITRQQKLLTQQRVAKAQADKDLKAAQAVLEDKPSDPTALKNQEKSIADQTAAQNSILQIENIISNLESKEAGGVSLTGSSVATIIAHAHDASVQQFSQVAPVVENIVMNVLGTDDTAALCLAHYNRANDKGSLISTKFDALCEAQMSLMTKDREAQIKIIDECKAKSTQSFNDCLRGSQIKLGSSSIHKTLSSTAVEFGTNELFNDLRKK